LKVDGQALTPTTCGEGYKYTYTLDASTKSLLSSVELVKGETTKTIELYEKASTKAIDLTSSEVNVTVSDNSSYQAKDTGYAFTIKSDANNEYFIPQIKFTSGVPNTFQVIELDVKNTKNEAVKMKLKITSTSGISVTKEIGLTANTARTVEVYNALSAGSKVASISIVFENQTLVDGNFEMINDRTIEIMGMRVK